VLDPRERIAYIRDKARRIGDRIGDRVAPSQARHPGLVETIRSVNEAGHWAASVYVPGEYSGNITLFRATKQPPWIVADRTLGWDRVVQGEIQIYDTPGHHADLVRYPRVRVLARQLDDALAKSQARFQPSYANELGPVR